MQTLNTQMDSLRGDCDRLQQSNTDIQRQRDILEEEKEDLIKDRIRQVKENERCIKVIENLENKISKKIISKEKNLEKKKSRNL